MLNFKPIPVKKLFFIPLLLAFSGMARSQETGWLAWTPGSSSMVQTPAPSSEGQAAYPISTVAVSVNPLGFIQFGPSINVEIGIKGNLALNVHTRFTSLGLISYVIRSDDGGVDELKGTAFGGGLLYFPGEKL